MGNGCHGNHHGNMCKLLCIILPLIKRLNLVLGYSFPGNHQLDSCLDSWPPLSYSLWKNKNDAHINVV